MFSTEDIYEVVVFSIGDTKAGTKMGKLQLKDTKDDSILNCILWEEALNRMDSKLFRTENQLRIVSGSFNEKFNNCLVSALELVKEAKTGLDLPEREKLYDEILSYVNNFSNEKLKNFILNYFEEHKDLIMVMPAAKLMHHNYVGGLLQHIYECLQFAEINMALFVNRLNEDDIYGACILHDIGKIYEYTIDVETGLVDYAEGFQKEWITHSQYGFTICMANGFNKIARMIAAHHGRAEWGAIIDLNEKDLEPELYFIHLVDNLSAKFGKINISLIEKKEV